MTTEFVPASRLYHVESRTPIAHPAHQASDEDVRDALEERAVRADGGHPSNGTEQFMEREGLTCPFQSAFLIGNDRRWAEAS